MSRLESMSRRIRAQIDGLNWAAEKISDVDGDVLEMGLGNGRTYDHLRQELPDRRIWVIDRELNPHPSCIPPKENFLQGEAEDMIEVLIERGVKMALIHYELGIGIDDHDAAESSRLAPMISDLIAPGGLVVTQQKLPTLRIISGPDAVAADRYFFYQR